MARHTHGEVCYTNKAAGRESPNQPRARGPEALSPCQSSPRGSGSLPGHPAARHPQEHAARPQPPASLLLCVSAAAPTSSSKGLRTQDVAGSGRAIKSYSLLCYLLAAYKLLGYLPRALPRAAKPAVQRNSSWRWEPPGTSALLGGRRATRPTQTYSTAGPGQVQPSPSAGPLEVRRCPQGRSPPRRWSPCPLAAPSPPSPLPSSAHPGDGAIPSGDRCRGETRWGVGRRGARGPRHLPAPGAHGPRFPLQRLSPPRAPCERPALRRSRLPAPFSAGFPDVNPGRSRGAEPRSQPPPGAAGAASPSAVPGPPPPRPDGTGLRRARAAALVRPGGRARYGTAQPGPVRHGPAPALAPRCGAAPQRDPKAAGGRAVPPPRGGGSGHPPPPARRQARPAGPDPPTERPRPP